MAKFKVDSDLTDKLTIQIMSLTLFILTINPLLTRTTSAIRKLEGWGIF
jgi:hypothetical protein